MKVRDGLKKKTKGKKAKQSKTALDPARRVVCVVKCGVKSNFQRVAPDRTLLPERRIMREKST